MPEFDDEVKNVYRLLAAYQAVLGIAIDPLLFVAVALDHRAEPAQLGYRVQVAPGELDRELALGRHRHAVGGRGLAAGVELALQRIDFLIILVGLSRPNVSDHRF